MLKIHFDVSGRVPLQGYFCNSVQSELNSRSIMEYRSFGRTGMKISPLALGSGGFGSRIDEVESFDIIDRAIDAGINIIDTANLYGRGDSEATVGEALRRNGARGRVVSTHPTPSDRPTNCAFGGQKLDVLYVTFGGGEVYRVSNTGLSGTPAL